MEEKEIYLFRLISTMTDIVIKSNLHKIELSHKDKEEIDYLFGRFGGRITDDSKTDIHIARADSIMKRWYGNEQDISFNEDDKKVIDSLFDRYALVTACY